MEPTSPSVTEWSAATAALIAQDSTRLARLIDFGGDPVPVHAPPNEGARILYIEDDEAVREGVASSLEASGYVVHAFTDGTAVPNLLDELRPDLALIDVTLPVGPDGFELAQYIRSKTDVPLFFLTASDTMDERLRGFELGADDYLVKPFSTRELLVRIRAVLRRAVPASRHLLTVGDVEVDLGTRAVRRAGHLISLTPTEFALVSTLARSPGRTWSKRDLFRQVWGLDEHAPHVVEVHVSAIRRKLEAHGPRTIMTGRQGEYFMSS